MTSPIESIVVWAHRRRWLVFALSLLVVIGSAAGLRRLQLDADVVNLLPANGRAITPFRSYLQQFGTLDQLFVVFTAPDGHSIADESETDRPLDRADCAPRQRSNGSIPAPAAPSATGAGWRTISCCCCAWRGSTARSSACSLAGWRRRSNARVNCSPCRQSRCSSWCARIRSTGSACCASSSAARAPAFRSASPRRATCRRTAVSAW